MARLTRPAHGTPRALYTPEEFRAAAEVLAAGSGRFSIDTERASDFRYDDRIFVLQVRRDDTETFLLAPEGHREELTDILAPVLNGEPWVLHSARNDLPYLAWLGLHPGELFDTEIAAKFAGFSRSGLGHLLDEIFDIQVDKAYQNVDWSTSPLPTAWLNYAALDVEMLPQLADALEDMLDEDGYLEWAYAEFDAVAAEFAGDCLPGPDQWRHTRHVRGLQRPEELAIAKALWMERDRLARELDKSPGKILRNQAIAWAARHKPDSFAELNRSEFRQRSMSRGLMWRMWETIEEARNSDPATWPQPVVEKASPTKFFWEEKISSLWDRYLAVQESLDQLAEELDLDRSLIIDNSTLRDVVWAVINSHYAPANSLRRFRNYLESLDPIATGLHNDAAIHAAIVNHGVRSWQADLITPILVREILDKPSPLKPARKSKRTRWD